MQFMLINSLICTLVRYRIILNVLKLKTQYWHITIGNSIAK